MHHDKGANPYPNAGNVPALKDARREPEASGVLRALKAMSTPEELVVLALPNRDSAQQAHAVSIAAAVVDHLVKRLLRAYADKKDAKGPGHLAKMTVLVNTLDRHLKQTNLNVSSAAFASYRKDPSAPILGPMAALLGGSSKRPMVVNDDGEDGA